MRLPNQSVGVRSASTTPVGAGILPAQALSSPVQESARSIIIVWRLPSGCYPCGSDINGGVMICCGG